MIGDEIDFEPPHGYEVYDVTYDGCTLSFLTETGRSVTMRGHLTLGVLRITEDDDIPDKIRGVFEGTYEADDFRYAVEVHFEDTYGVIYEKPFLPPDCIVPVDSCSSYVQLQDPHQNAITCIRDLKAP